MAFFVLAFAWSWGAWGIAILFGRPWADPVTLVLWGLGALGPLTAAAVLVALGQDRRSPPRFWISVLVPRISLGMALALVSFAAGPYVIAGLVFAGEMGVHGEIEIGFLAAGLAAGLAEEPGWRGYAQDELQRPWRPVMAMLVVGVAWAAWHLPLFAIPSGVAGMPTGLRKRERRPFVPTTAGVATLSTACPSRQSCPQVGINIAIVLCG
jgi:membrane protease YdiL (CAAX protease family)